MFWEDGGFSESAKTAILVSFKLTLGREVDPEHILVALLDDPNSPLSKACQRIKPGANLKSLRETIVTAVRKDQGQPYMGTWSDQLVSSRTREMVAAATASPAWGQASLALRQNLVCAAALQVAKSQVQRTFGFSGLNVKELEATLASDDGARVRPPVFDGSGTIDRSSFDGGAKGVLRLVESEGRGLGLSRIGTPLLLFALVARENGFLERALRLQLIDPRQLHQSLLLHLKALGKNRLNDALVLKAELMQSAVADTLQRAADLAFDLGRAAIGEADLIRALLIESDQFIETFLAQSKVKVKELADFAAQWRPGDEVEESTAKGLPSLEEVERRLRNAVVGQDQAIDMVMPFLKRLRFGFPRLGRPMGVFLFLGMSGTGKTQLAKEIAKAIYGSEDQLIFLEMGQFGDQYSKTMFVGAPPGYVGYGEGLLTNGLRDKPESVVLFDEVEKAYKTVFDVVLRFLDEGQISDPAGQVRDGRKCILILTSNHALDVLRPTIERQTRAGRLSSAERDAIRTEIREAILRTEFFRPEFINRVDELVLFNTFDEAAYRQILTNQIAAEKSRFRELKDLEIEVGEDVLEHLVDACLSRSSEGARVCSKLVSNQVVSRLIDFFSDETNRDVPGACLHLTPRNEIEVVPLGTREART